MATADGKVLHRRWANVFHWRLRLSCSYAISDSPRAGPITPFFLFCWIVFLPFGFVGHMDCFFGNDRFNHKIQHASMPKATGKQDRL
eukprot:5410476-Amphidinium_carterae.1